MQDTEAITKEAIEAFKRVAKEQQLNLNWKSFIRTDPRMAATIILAMVDFRLNVKATPEDNLKLWMEVYRIFVNGRHDRSWEDLSKELSRFVILKNV